MEGFEKLSSLETSPTILLESDDNHNDLSTVPLLLLPYPYPLHYPEISTARSREMEQKEQEDFRKLRQFRVAALYMACVADVVLRASAVMLTLIALALTVMNGNGLGDRTQSELSFMTFFLSRYMLSVNVVVFLYSCAILSLAIFRSINCTTRGSNNLVFLLSIFQLDQTFAYLLISASLNALGSISNLTGANSPSKSGFCERTLACALISLLAFSALAAASLISGFRLVAKLFNYCEDAPLALGILHGDDCGSPASKILP